MAKKENSASHFPEGAVSFFCYRTTFFLLVRPTM